MLLIDRLKRPQIIVNQRDGWEFGRYHHGDPLILPHRTPHMLVSGVTGSGKSTVLHRIVETVGQTDAQIFFVDLKFGIEAARHVDRLDKLATSLKNVDVLLADLRTEIEARGVMLAKAGATNWSEKDRIYVIIDEVAELSSVDPGVMLEVLTSETADKELTAQIRKAKQELAYRQDVLASLARLSRACGVTIICATQFASHEAISTQLRFNLDARISCRQSTPEGLDVGLGPGYRHLHGSISAGDYSFHTLNLDHGGDPFQANVSL